MNAQKLTQKSLEAVAAAQRTATEYGNPQVEQEHVLFALCEQEGGLIGELLTKMEIPAEGVRTQALDAVEKLPRMNPHCTAAAAP